MYLKSLRVRPEASYSATKSDRKLRYEREGIVAASSKREHLFSNETIEAEILFASICWDLIDA